LSTKKEELNEIAQRIIDLSAIHPSNKEFIDQCGIANHSLITDLRHKRIENPGAHILAQIVNGTGCSGTWLLTGKGKMFERKRSDVDEKGISYVRVSSTYHLLVEFEKQIKKVKISELSVNIDFKLSKLLCQILERRNFDKKNNSN